MVKNKMIATANTTCKTRQYIPIMIKILTVCLAALSAVITGCAPIGKSGPETPANALERLQAGNKRFVRHHMRHPDQSATRVAQTAAGQKPYAVVITCSDSRVAPEIVFDEGIGNLFVIRNAGNIVEEEDVLASVEYAVGHLGVHTVVIMGHERCGAIEAMTHEPGGDEPRHVAAIVQRLRNEPEEQKILAGSDKGDQLVHKCVIANVEHGVAVLTQQLRHLKSHGAETGISVAGAIYDVQTGVVHFQHVESTSH